MGLAASALLVAALGIRSYGSYVVLLAVQAGLSVGWNANVIAGYAARIRQGQTASSSWKRYLIRHLVATSVVAAVGVLVLDMRRELIVVSTVAASEILVVWHKPTLIALGRQDRVAGATAGAAVTRLAAILGLWALNALSPLSAVAVQAVGYAVGAALQGVPGKSAFSVAAPIVATRSSPTAWLFAGDSGRWLERHGPVLVAAWSIGTTFAGAFELLLKIAQVIVEAFGVLSTVFLVDMTATRADRHVIRQRLRWLLPLAAAIAIGYALITPVAIAMLAELEDSVVASLQLSTWLLTVIILGAPLAASLRAYLLARGQGRAVGVSQLTASGGVIAGLGLLSTSGPAIAAAVMGGHVLGGAVLFWASWRR